MLKQALMVGAIALAIMAITAITGTCGGATSPSREEYR